MKKNIEIKQKGIRDCASACLLSIIRYYGGDASYDELTLLLKTDKNGTNAFNIIKVACMFGFDGYGIKCTYDNIQNYNLPCIVHVLRNNYYHFMVLYKIDNNYTLMDPAFGFIKISPLEFEKIYLGTSIILKPVKKIISSNYYNTFSKYIFTVIRGCKIEVINIILYSFIFGILCLISSLYLKFVLNILDVNKLIKVSFVFVTIIIVKNIISFIRSRCIILFDKRISYKINKDIIKHVFNLPYLFFKNKSSGEIMYRLNDLNNFRILISDVVSNVIFNIIICLLCIVLMFYIDSKMFIFVVIFTFIYLLIEVLFKNTFRKYVNEYKNSVSEYNVKLNEMVNGYETINNLNMLNYATEKLNYVNYKSLNKHYNLDSYISNQSFIKSMCIDLINLVIIFYGILYLDVSNLILFIIIFGNYVDSIYSVFSIIPRMYECKNLYESINDLYIARGRDVSSMLCSIYGDICVRGLSYSYNSVSSVFNNISFDIKVASRILFFGKSGSGKSTLFKIMLKYISDYDGKIFINNNDLIDVPYSVIGNSFTYVSQNEYLFHMSIKDNIMFYRNVSFEDYERVLDICKLRDFIASKTFKDEQIIEDNGFNISGGEKQKVILARALLKNSNYIILDEALSEVPVFEEIEILNNIFKYFKNNTIIYSSHRRELLDIFDNVYYLERS